MNLFITDLSPEVCAANLDDKRVGKLLMEANQMLSLAVKIHLYERMWKNHVGEGKLTDGFAHKNHPVSLWVRDSQGNYNFTVEIARSLAKEFEFRFGKKHASSHRTEYIVKVFGKEFVPNDDMTEFQNSAKNSSLELDFSHLPIPLSYREYLKARWETDFRTPIWTKRKPPEWYDS